MKHDLHGMNDEGRKKSTVQGRDTLVLVAASGGKAGPPRPSSSDCGSMVVDSQATRSRATGADDVVDPFQRRSSLRRTPPKKPQDSITCEQKQTDANSNNRKEMLDNMTTLMISDDEDVFSDGQQIAESIEKMAYKRKRIETPEKDVPCKEMVELKAMIETLVKRANGMKTLISEHPNTKVELKKEVLRMSRNIEVLAAKCNEWNTYPGRATSNTKIIKGQANIQTGEVGCQADLVKTKPGKKSVGTQVNIQDEIARETKEKEEIIKILNEGTTVDNIKIILDKEWPKDTYKRVKMEQGSLAQAKHDMDIALVIDTKPNIEKGLLKGMINTPK